MKSKSFKLYYITHLKNVPSILKNGILSHENVENNGIAYTPIYDAQIVAGRRNKLTPDGRSLWHFANLYFQPRNAMLFRVSREKSVGEIAVISVHQTILNRHDVLVTTGNAASAATQILGIMEGRKIIPQIVKEATAKEWWSDVDGSKRNNDG